MDAISRQHEIVFLLTPELRKIEFYQRQKIAFNALLQVAQLIVKLIDDISLISVIYTEL